MGNYYDYDRIKSIVLPATITKIGSGTFSGLSNVRSITIKGAVTEIGEYAFAGCTDLTSITLPSLLKKLGAWAFETCKSLKTITIPSGVTTLPNYVFTGCSSLATINIPSALKNFGINAFSGTAWLKAGVYAAKTQSALILADQSLVLETKQFLIKKCTMLITAIGGANRYATNAAVNEKFKTQFDNNRVCVVTGKDFPDALTAGVHAAKTRSALILADQSLVMETKQFLIKKCPMLITAIGGAGAVPNDILDKMVAVVKSGW